MNFHVLTLFPEMIENGMNTSITGRAITKGLLTLEAVNIRDYAFNPKPQLPPDAVSLFLHLLPHTALPERFLLSPLL